MRVQPQETAHTATSNLSIEMAVGQGKGDEEKKAVLARVSNRRTMEALKEQQAKATDMVQDPFNTPLNHAGPSNERKEMASEDASDDLISSIQNMITVFVGALNSHLESTLGVHAGGLKLGFEEYLSREVEGNVEGENMVEAKSKNQIVFCDHCL